MRQPVRQLAVVGQHNQARGIGIESADTKDTLISVDEVYCFFPAPGIAVRADDALGLVQKEIDLLCGTNFFPAYSDNIFFRINEGRQRIYYFAVDLNLSAEYQLLALSPRVDTRRRQYFL